MVAKQKPTEQTEPNPDMVRLSSTLIQTFLGEILPAQVIILYKSCFYVDLLDKVFLFHLKLGKSLLQKQFNS